MIEESLLTLCQSPRHRLGSHRWMTGDEFENKTLTVRTSLTVLRAMRVYAPIYYPVDWLALFTPPAPLELVDPGLYRGLDLPRMSERSRDRLRDDARTPDDAHAIRTTPMSWESPRSDPLCLRLLDSSEVDRSPSGWDPDARRICPPDAARRRLLLSFASPPLLHHPSRDALSLSHGGQTPRESSTPYPSRLLHLFLLLLLTPPPSLYLLLFRPLLPPLHTVTTTTVRDTTTMESATTATTTTPPPAAFPTCRVDLVASPPRRRPGSAVHQ